MFYTFLRWGVVPLCFIGYILYQILYKRKTLASLKTDLLYVAFFVVVFLGLYLLFSQP